MSPMKKHTHPHTTPLTSGLSRDPENNMAWPNGQGNQGMWQSHHRDRVLLLNVITSAVNLINFYDGFNIMFMFSILLGFFFPFMVFLVRSIVPFILLFF